MATRPPAGRSGRSQSPSAGPRLPPGADSYLKWHVATGFRYLSPDDRWLPFIVVFKPGRTFAEFTKQQWLQTERPPVVIPEILLSLPEPLWATGSCVLLIDRDQIAQVFANAGWQDWVELAEVGLPLTSIDPKPAKRISKYAPTGRERVLIGVVDDAIAYAHRSFRLRSDPLKSRVSYFWSQDPVPGDLNYGRELTRAGIEARLAASMYAGTADEDQVYRADGLESYSGTSTGLLGMRATHGTHVMDLAARIPADSDEESRPIIAVQLARKVTLDTSGSLLTSHAFLAFVYILLRAHEIRVATGLDLPLVINLSYGMNAGPHDGTSPLEQAIDSMIEVARAAGFKLSVVLPAGNSRLSRGRAIVDLPANGVRELMWRIQPEDRTPSYLELHLGAPPPTGPSPQVEIEFVAPDGTLAAKAQQGELHPTSGYPHPCFIDYQTPPQPGGRRKVLVALLPTAPTDALDRKESTAASGLWTVKVTNVGPPTRIDAWVQRDDTPVGHKRLGRQSHLEDSRYQRLTHNGREILRDPSASASDVRRSGTLSAIATGRHTIIAGAYRKDDGASAGYSSLGPILRCQIPGRTQDSPDVAGVGDDTSVLRGVLAAGARSGARVAMSGTSVAAPQVTARLADELSAGRKGDRANARGIAQSDEAAHPVVRPPLDPEEAGAGRLQAEGSAIGVTPSRLRRRAPNFD